MAGPAFARTLQADLPCGFTGQPLAGAGVRAVARGAPVLERRRRSPPVRQPTGTTWMLSFRSRSLSRRGVVARSCRICVDAEENRRGVNDHRDSPCRCRRGPREERHVPRGRGLRPSSAKSPHQRRPRGFWFRRRAGRSGSSAPSRAISRSAQESSIAKARRRLVGRRRMRSWVATRCSA